MIGARGTLSRMTAAGLAAAVLFAGSMLFAASPALAKDKNGCNAKIDTPHFSTGAGGVIVKGRWSCTAVPTNVFLGTRTTGLFLWLCPQQPQPSESYLGDPSNHCVIKTNNIEDIFVKVADRTYTRYAPPQGQPGVHGSGYWIACSVWYSSGPNGTSSDITTFGPIWHGSG
jgi:hypothetical protein